MAMVRYLSPVIIFIITIYRILSSLTHLWEEEQPLSKQTGLGRKLLDATSLTDPAPLRSVIDQYIVPLVHLLKNLEIKIPPEIDIA